jgi:hypothetical protein
MEEEPKRLVTLDDEVVGNDGQLQAVGSLVFVDVDDRDDPLAAQTSRRLECDEGLA